MFNARIIHKRRPYRWLPVLLLCTVAQADPESRPAGAAGPLDIGNRRQLFLDRHFLADSRGVELTVHPPCKTGEHTIEPQFPWEKGGIGCYNSVLKDGGIYHFWYRAGKAMCYARSKDGIHWEKPMLRLAEYEGSRENNMVVGHGAAGVANSGHGGMVFLDPNASKDERFRMITRVNEPEKVVILFSSPDGIHWKLTDDRLLTFTPRTHEHHLDSQNVIFWDDRINKYVAYMRRSEPGTLWRTIARSESPRLGGFEEAQNAPIVIGHDDQDLNLGKHTITDYYTSAAIKYPWAQDAYFMFPTCYFHYVGDGLLSEFPTEAPTNAGPLDTQFAASRDGIHWERFDRRPFVRVGFRGAFDSMEARVFYGMVPSVDDQELYLYYLGTDRLHGWDRDERNNTLLTKAGLQPTHDVALISRVVLRRDGFVSVRAAYTGGEFTTPVLRFTGRELVLNVDTSATGLVQCELLDDAGRPIDGYRLADSDRIHTANQINRVVSWHKKSDLSALTDKPIRLRVVMRNADLYAFQFR